MNFGIGFDVHPLVTGRKLVLGGVDIPFKKGLDGWSDADVLTHAIMDALLGAAIMGDIGKHFPPGVPKYQGISSLDLLAEVRKKLFDDDWSIQNIDATVITEKPQLKRFENTMRKRLSQRLGIHINQINIKASTANGVGSIGRGEGIAAMAIASLTKNTNE